MLAQSPIRHVFKHSAATNILPEQHHLRPSIIPISNVVQQIEPLPGGPGVWDVAVPFDANIATIDLVSGWQANDVGGQRGGHWTATRTAWLEATGISFGGPTNWRNGSYVGVFSKVANALDISHRIWTTSGQYVALTDAYLYQTGPSTRVCRMVFTNYGGSYYTLTAYGQIGIIG